MGAGTAVGVTISVVTQPTRLETGFIAVSLPKGSSTEGIGFRVPLPAEVSNAANVGASVAVPAGTPTSAVLPGAAPAQGGAVVAATPELVIEVRAVIDGRTSPLPDWLRYSAEQQMFIATAVPDGGLPITIEIIVNGQRTLMVISERSN
jgi:hypothetical protein